MLTLTNRIDMRPGAVPLVIHLGQYDSDFSLVFELYSSAGNFTVESGTTAMIRGTKTDGHAYDADATIDVSAKTVTVAGSEQMTAAKGRNVYELVLTKSDKVLSTANFILDVERAAMDADTIASESVLKELNAIIAGAETATEAAADAASAADQAEDAAESVSSASAQIATNTADISDLKADFNQIDEFLAPIGFDLVAYDNADFVNGMWANGSWRNTGNYAKYRSVRQLIPLRDYELIAETESYTDLVLSIDLYDSSYNRISSLLQNDTVIQSGKYSIVKDTVVQSKPTAAYISVGVGKLSGSIYYDLPADLELSIIQPSSAENISDRVSAIEAKILGDVVYTNTDFVNGMYANGSWRDTGNYGKYRSVHELIPLDDYTVIAETETYTNMVISVDLFDSSNNRLRTLVQNDTVIQSGSYVISKNSVLASQPTAAKISVGIGKVSGSTFYDLPSDLKLSVIQKAIPTVIVVDCNGGGDYKTIESAVNNAPDSISNKVTILIKPGVYDEHLHIGGSRYLSFIGEDRETCVIRSHTGMYTDAPIWIDGNFTIENLTLQMLDDEAPETWTPGLSQSDPAIMLPGYALHIDNGSSTAVDAVYGYKLGVVRNCTLYSVAFPAIGAGLHANQKLVFDNCDFIRKTSSAYHNAQYQYYTNYAGAMIIHDSTHTGDANQNLEIINCRFICNLGKSATFRFKYGTPANVKYALIDNTFWCEETSTSVVDAELTDSVMLGYSHGNNNDMFNA